MVAVYSVLCYNLSAMFEKILNGIFIFCCMIETVAGVLICSAFAIAIFLPMSLICILFLLIWMIFYGINSFFGWIYSVLKKIF